MTSVRIGVDCRELESGTVTGIGRYVTNFLVQARRARPDWPLLLYGNRRTVLPRALSDLRLETVPEWGTLWWDQVQLPRVLKRDRADVFLSPYIKGPLGSPCPYVTTVHDLLFLKVASYTGWQYAPYNFVFRYWGALMARRAARIITVSHYSKRDIVELFQVPESKIVVIPNGLPPEFLQQAAQEREGRGSALGLAGPLPYVLYVGNFKPHKNVRTLLKAFQRVRTEAGLDCRLVLAGEDRAHRRQCERLVGRLGLTEFVVFTGLVSDDQLPGLYRRAAVFVFPSLYEGFGMPVLEAMACGTPVVASNSSSVPEVLADAGLLVDPTDVEAMARGILLFLTDPVKREQSIQKGLRRAGQFSLAETSGRTLRLLEEVARDGRKS